MTDQTDTQRDDGRPWGYIDKGVWWQLPKPPLVNGGHGPPPFDVTLPDGRVRHVVHEPVPADQMAAVDEVLRRDHETLKAMPAD